MDQDLTDLLEVYWFFNYFIDPFSLDGSQFLGGDSDNLWTLNCFSSLRSQLFVP